MNSILPRRAMFYFGLTFIFTFALFFINPEDAWVSGILESVERLISLGWIIVMLRTSGFTKTVYYKVILVLCGLLLFGAVFKIQHWPISNPVLLSGCLGIVIVYLIRFWNKKKKGLLDYLKVIWVIMTLATSWLILMHAIGKEYSILKELVFLNLIFVYSLETDRKRLGLQVE
jgi:hypothetical protein